MLELHPLSPTIGAEVAGLDLSEPLGESGAAAVRAALLEHKVLFFRDQDITTEQHVAFGRCFGDLEVHPFVPHKDGFPEVMQLTHDRERKGQENTWHSDVTWRLEPSLGSVLRAIELPPVGGDTLFADMYAAYDGLPASVQERVNGLSAIHDFTHVFGRRLDAEKLAEMQRQYPQVEHPVIRTHPETGRKGIYVNAAFTVAIKGMGDEESRKTLRLLYAQASIPEHQCRFRWAPGSIAFWDNRACQHYAVSDYWPNVRRMERVTIIGDRPV
jgi:taurine dioxygenase